MQISPQTTLQFQKGVLNFYRKAGRAFPWRKTRNPYAILVSEIMLQQTQTERVVPKYLEWMKRFPTAKSLAQAPVSDVLKKWQGLGYNRRALNLKRAAEEIVKKYGGVFPKTIYEVDALPGVGPYTAGAVVAFAFNIPSAFIETNIRTVYLRFFFEGRGEVRDEEILEVISQTLPPEQHSNILKNVGMLESKCSVREWYNALMDYGAMLKETVGNQNVRGVHYAKQSKFKGSRRELRGKILRKAAEQKLVAAREFASETFSVSEIVLELVREGFLRKKGSKFMLA